MYEQMYLIADTHNNICIRTSCFFECTGIYNSLSIKITAFSFRNVNIVADLQRRRCNIGITVLISVEGNRNCCLWLQKFEMSSDPGFDIHQHSVFGGASAWERDRKKKMLKLSLQMPKVQDAQVMIVKHSQSQRNTRSAELKNTRCLSNTAQFTNAPHKLFPCVNVQ